MNSATQTLHLGVVGPLPPPAGGMATQTRQLVSLLREEKVEVSLVQNNKPFRPKLIGKVKGVRALFRLIPYLFEVWKLAGSVDVIHLMANSGWSWQLFSAPVVWLGWCRNTPVIVAYHGGEAKTYFDASFKWVRPTLNKATLIVVPSGYLEKVFAEFNATARVVPNAIDVTRFKPSCERRPTQTFKLIVTRNLEAIYGIETAIKAIAILKQQIPNVLLEIAGSGPQKSQLEKLVRHLGLQNDVRFVGRLDANKMAKFYQSADVMLNPATVDNMPVSILEALASGVAVITTNVGGISYIVEHEKTALLFPVGDEVQMASQVVSLYQNPEIRENLISNGLDSVQPYAWPCVKGLWIDLYNELKVSK